jgi:nitrogen-specific signal transduction histidine kinase
MTAQEDDLRRELQTLRENVRAAVHNVNGPLGVLRMTAAFLNKGKSDPAKQGEYTAMMVQTVDKIIAALGALRGLGDDAEEHVPPAPEQGHSSGGTTP